ncbi:hypothetical protein CC78DRAFT_587228 [Lojkania enalia]|uniref:Uncharacterized protein n=1 Tax=Lojkania enalia TaxID=147567 RepID=A0A9P4JWS2_9PLEO|nr:hypothetical protein CC78DRAFT_587228 [Didymosphaeria enalia]
MPELTFVFGPNNTFFFDCPKSWKFHNIPPTLRQLFNASMNPGWRIAQPYCLALGPQNNSPEPIWYLGCKVVDGQDKIFYSQTHFDLNYPDLSRWTKTIPDAPRACHVVFGPGLSYFACAQGYGSIWAGVPGELTDKVQKAYDTPAQVSLGLNNAWFVMFPDGYFWWNFYGNYAGLDQILKSAEPGTVAQLAISPYNKEQYFVAFKDRTVKYNFIGAPEWMPQMQEVFNEWQAEIMQRQAYRQSQQYFAPMPPSQQWSNYPPTPGYPSPPVPATPLPPYSSPITPPYSPYSPYGAPGPNAMYGSMMPPPQPPKGKKLGAPDKKKDAIVGAAATVPVAGVLIAKTVMQEGSQTCTVM